MTTIGPKILIVDDEPDLLDITAAYLEMEGYSTAYGAERCRCLEILNSTVPDLILSDITMPGMSGFDLFEKNPFRFQVPKHPIHFPLRPYRSRTYHDGERTRQRRLFDEAV